MDYRKALAKDPKLKKLLKHDVEIQIATTNVMMKLINSILSQQLSTTVAQVMQKRFLGLFGGKIPKAEQVMSLTEDDIRNIGISRPKARYIRNVAEFMIEHKLTTTKLKKKSNEEIIELLTQIKGVGQWTVEMLLIFGLAREDVFAVDDLGIQKGMIDIFKLHDLSKKDLRLKMMELSKRWSPYRSYVCLMMWRHADSLK